MERESKTLEEIFREKYDRKEVVKNPFLCCEAVGYLKALKQFSPSEKWVHDELEMLLFCFSLNIM